jgi:hypothetical protein
MNLLVFIQIYTKILGPATKFEPIDVDICLDTHTILVDRESGESILTEQQSLYRALLLVEWR